MPVTKHDLEGMDPLEIFEWEVDNLGAGLEELGITVGNQWSKSKKVYELNNAILEVKPINVEQSKPMDSSIMMMQVMQQQNRAFMEQNSQSKVFMEKIAEKVSNMKNGGIEVLEV